jgi:hypothetical protein
MDDLEEYKTFVLQQVRTKAVYKKTDVTNQLVAALFQFTLAPSVYLEDIIPKDSLSLKYKQIFDLTGKANNTYLNTWFLHKFGYKYCPKCNQIKTLDSYSSSSSSADKLRFYCKNCSSKDGKDYYITNADKIAETQKAYRAANPDKIAEANKAYQLVNAAKIKEYRVVYNLVNADKIAETQKVYYSLNADKIAETHKAYQLANPDKCNALKAKRRARKLCATPKWLTPEQHKQILAFYTEAKRLEQETGVRYHVDHIVPLQGGDVCGLHVPWNLQVLTATENIRKSNKCQT